MTGLSSLVPFYKEAMEMVLDVEAGTSRALSLSLSLSLSLCSQSHGGTIQTHSRLIHLSTEEEAHRVPDVSIVESSAELLYGLIHQRYIITRQGLQQMVRDLQLGQLATDPGRSLGMSSVTVRQV